MILDSLDRDFRDTKPEICREHLHSTRAIAARAEAVFEVTNCDLKRATLY
jgi:hypothetical protein